MSSGSTGNAAASETSSENPRRLLILDLEGTSQGSFVNRLHLISYCLSPAPRVWVQLMHLRSKIKNKTANCNLWSWDWLNTVEFEFFHCASDRLRNSRRRRHVMRARGITALYLYRVRDCLPYFIATCFDGWWTTNEGMYFTILPYFAVSVRGWLLPTVALFLAALFNWVILLSMQDAVGESIVEINLHPFIWITWNGWWFVTGEERKPKYPKESGGVTAWRRPY